MIKKAAIRHTIIIIICLLLICVLIAGIALRTQQTFFRRLEYDEIASIKIYSLFAYDGVLLTQTLSSDDTHQVYELLHQVEMTGTGNIDFRDLCPINTKMYILELTDGSVMEVSPNASYIIIDSQKCFREDYTLGNELADLHFALDAKYFPK